MSTNHASPLNGIAPLPHLGCIEVSGEDAAKFIHGQLTQDFSLLGTDTARLAAFCSPKGRMQASFIGWKRQPDSIVLVCRRDLLAATLKRLSMFVLRAKARLRDASDDYTLLGLAGSATLAAADGKASNIWGLNQHDAAQVAQLYPADGIARQLWLAPKDTPTPSGSALDTALWLWGDVRSGVADVCQATFETFVPQMLNYESIGGVNFKKGCYPGQEVVARSQFRGTLKRRAYLAHSAASLQAGQELALRSEPDNAVAVVAQAAAAPGGGYEAIVCVQLSALDAGPLCVAGSDVPVTLTPPPYPLLDDI